MMSPVAKGKVPASTPELDQPISLSRLETATATPKAPVSAAVALSSPLREIIECPAVSVRDEPAFLRADLADALDILGHELLEGIAGEEGVGLRGALDVLLPLGRLL